MASKATKVQSFLVAELFMNCISIIPVIISLWAHFSVVYFMWKPKQTLFSSSLFIFIDYSFNISKLYKSMSNWFF